MSIILEHVDYYYTPGDRMALQDISFTLRPGEIMGLAGSSGAGKSTLLKICSGLLMSRQGFVKVDNEEMGNQKGHELAQVRRKVGLVGQIPEKQIFERSVYSEIAFGPENLGLDKYEVEARVRKAMLQVGWNFDEWKDKIPLRLSSGQKRRVAIASILALQPSYLLMDEPTAGLDWEGSRELYRTMQRLKTEEGKGILFVSHRWQDLLALSDHLLVLNKGRIQVRGSVVEITEKYEREYLAGVGLTPPRQVLKSIAARGIEINTRLNGAEEAAREIVRVMGDGEHAG